MNDKLTLNEDFDIPGADEASDMLGYDPDAEPTLEDQGWEYVASKDVYDEDGFRDSYMWYRKDGNNRFFFSSDVDYGDPEYFDWETEGDEAAQEWFDSYGEDEGEEPPVDLDEAVEDNLTAKAEIGTPRGTFYSYKGTWKDFESEDDRDDWGLWFDHYTDDNKHYKIMHNHIDNSAIAVLKEGLNESKRGFVEKYRGYSIHDAGDRYVITNENGLNVGETRFGIPVCRGMIDDMIDGKEADKITEAKRTKFPRGFNLGSSNNQNVKVRNPYNYTIQELSINNKAKTFERGNFSVGRADIELKNRQEYEDIVDLLKDQGYTEVKSDYHSLRNKTRKGVITEEKGKRDFINVFVKDGIIVQVSGKLNLKESLDNSETVTKEDILEYAKLHGDRSAADLLLLGGYEFFDGTADEYDALLKELESKADSEKVDESLSEGADTQIENSVASRLIEAINDEWKTIDLYNSIISELSMTDGDDYKKMIPVIEDIVNEENVHVGQLQKALELISPDTTDIEKGEKEAEGQISGGDPADDKKALVNESYSDDEYDDFEQAGIYGGDMTYCPICGRRLEWTEDADQICPKCEKSAWDLAQERRVLDKKNKNESVKDELGKDSDDLTYQDFISGRISKLRKDEVHKKFEQEKDPTDKSAKIIDDGYGFEIIRENGKKLTYNIYDGYKYSESVEDETIDDLPFNEDDEIDSSLEWYSTDIKEIPYGKNKKRIKNRKLVDIDKEPVRNLVNEGLEDSKENADLIRTALASGSLDRDAFIDYVLTNTPDEMLSGAVNFIGTSNFDTEDDLDFLGDGVDVTDSFADDLFIDEDTLEDGSVITLKDYSKSNATMSQNDGNNTITMVQNDSEPACDDCDDLPDGVDITLVDVDDDKPLEEEKPLQEMGPLAATLLTAVAPVVADRVMDKVLPEEKEDENKVDDEVHGNADDDDVDIKGI